MTAFGVVSAQEQKVETTAEAWLRSSANPVADCVVAIVGFIVADSDVAVGLVLATDCSVVGEGVMALLTR